MNSPIVQVLPVVQKEQRCSDLQRYLATSRVPREFKAAKAPSSWSSAWARSVAAAASNIIAALEGSRPAVGLQGALLLPSSRPSRAAMVGLSLHRLRFGCMGWQILECLLCWVVLQANTTPLFSGSTGCRATNPRLGVPAAGFWGLTMLVQPRSPSTTRDKVCLES